MFMNQHRCPALNISGLVLFVVLPSELPCFASLRDGLCFSLSSPAWVVLADGSLLFFSSPLFSFCSFSPLIASQSQRLCLRRDGEGRLFSSPLSQQGTVPALLQVSAEHPCPALRQRNRAPRCRRLSLFSLLFPSPACTRCTAVLAGWLSLLPSRFSPLRLYCPAGVQSVRRWPPFSLSSLSLSAVPVQYPPGQGGSSGNVQSAYVGP